MAGCWRPAAHYKTGTIPPGTATRAGGVWVVCGWYAVGELSDRAGSVGHRGHRINRTLQGRTGHRCVRSGKTERINDARI